MITPEESIAGRCKQYRMFWLAHQGDDALREFISTNVRTVSAEVICALIDVDIELRLLSSLELNEHDHPHQSRNGELWKNCGRSLLEDGDSRCLLPHLIAGEATRPHSIP
jgi:hypothetical protein